MPMHLRVPLCPPTRPQFQSQPQTSAVFFVVVFFTPTSSFLFPSSPPEPQNVCHFSPHSFSSLSSFRYVPCQLGLLSGPFSFSTSFLVRCHQHLVICSLFDYIWCPWLWRGCHLGAFGLILNLLLSHTQANTHKCSAWILLADILSQV